MFEQDYLMRQLLLFFQALRRSWELKDEDDEPGLAAETLENAISNAVDMDGSVLLSLSPESISSVMRVSGVDPKVTRFIAHSLLLESVYLSDAGDEGLSAVRAAQARAIAQSYGFDLPEDPSDFESLSEGLDELAVPELAASGFDGPGEGGYAGGFDGLGLADGGGHAEDFDGFARSSGAASGSPFFSDGFSVNDFLYDDNFDISG